MIVGNEDIKYQDDMLLIARNNIKLQIISIILTGIALLLFIRFKL